MRMPDGLEVQITGMRAKVARENERERESLVMACAQKRANYQLAVRQ